MLKSFISITFLFLYGTGIAQVVENRLKINELDYFESNGFDVFVFNNYYGLFNDEKASGIEFIHHGVRTATNGDVRLNPTPEQWDHIPKFVERKINKDQNIIEAFLTYPEYSFEYVITVKLTIDGLIISVNINNPLPKEIEGKAGFNLEFLPSAYFEKSYLMDDNGYTFPLYPSGPMEIASFGETEPLPLATGHEFVLAPEDPYRRVTIESMEEEISLFDGRNKAQNGWYVVRTLIPSGKTGNVIEWKIKSNTIPDWIRTPMIAYSQLGYHPDQKKIAVIEFDKNDNQLSAARLLKVEANGILNEKLKGELNKWGRYLRYDYFTFDFSDITEEGIYLIEYDTIRTSVFRISENIYEDAWHPTLDIYLPVQMDHMMINEGYRVWHGASHLDDALQAPVNHQHFDLYAQGPTTDTKYNPGEHIPGLDVGGWYDAGDYDIRTQTQYSVILNLVHAYEDFGIERDETLIIQKDRYVDMHHPDGEPDILQQVEHGSLQLLAQFNSIGHAANGIVAAHLNQYTHLGDGSTKTDNLIFNPDLDSLESDGFTSGTFDDRWVFTSKSSALNYGSIAALTAASRVLQVYNNELADECYQTALKIWDEEQTHEPDLFRHGNTTGGELKFEELKAAVELLITTKEKRFADRIGQLLSEMKESFNFNAVYFVRAIPFMDSTYYNQIEKLVKVYKTNLDDINSQNPFEVLITSGGWAGGGTVVNIALTNYVIHKEFPDIIEEEDVFSGLNYIYGCHPGSNISFVSGVGTISKKVAYGNNRADYSFIAGGVVPGVLILKPDFPENKEDWPFLWGENEYVVNLASSYIYLVNAVNKLLNSN